ncbi:hypothetical protein SUGI_1002820 [Cryptomeria japonica]|uniref:transcription factor MYB1 n=1 Tax=Cryptomeria japonica TaxID=3369 RepID=UPI00241484BC|nr:transcription factor MYB1 [Cryptomeria japonica]GLJ47500.1 hypothetical protein SUGI_1002820 [Cryptomeria japonica]
MGRSPCCSKDSAINRGAWTAYEDMILREYIATHGAGGWRSLPIKAGLKRCGKSCRLRWLNYLRPDIKRGNISVDEEDLIIRLHRLLGNRWSLIAGRLPGRTDNEIKNYWNTHLRKKCFPRDQSLPNPNTKSNPTSPGDDHIAQYTPVKATAVRLAKYCNKYFNASSVPDHQDFNPTDTSQSLSLLLSEELVTENECGFIDPALDNSSSQSMQIKDQLSTPCMANVIDSTLPPSKHCLEDKSESLLYNHQVQSAESDLLYTYSREDFDIEEFLARPDNNLEGFHCLDGEDESFTVSDGEGMEGMYSMIG